MAASSRTKGQRAEAEVAAIYRAHGFAVRGLEGRGDHLVIGHGLVIHSEVKRHEVLRLPAWTRQAMREAPPDALPVVAFRRNREAWQAVAPLVRVLGHWNATASHEAALLVEWLDGTPWARLTLPALLERLTS